MKFPLASPNSRFVRDRFNSAPARGAARRLGERFIVIELSEHYFNCTEHTLR